LVVMDKRHGLSVLCEVSRGERYWEIRLVLPRTRQTTGVAGT
jgi:hypothetical protein